jgi:hypothetical protein
MVPARHSTAGEGGGVSARHSTAREGGCLLDIQQPLLIGMNIMLFGMNIMLNSMIINLSGITT